jgi:hypothetical protein
VAAAPGGIAGVATGALLADGPNLFGIGPGGMPGMGPMGATGPMGPMGMAVLGGIASGSGVFGGALGAGSQPAGGQPREELPRHVPQGGGADVAHTDYGKLTTAGSAPTVYGMLFAVVADHDAVVYEVLNDPDHATYVYDSPPDGVGALSAALASIGFRVSAVYSDASGVDSQFRDAVARLPQLSMLRTSFRGRAIHADGWEQQLDALLARRAG